MNTNPKAKVVVCYGDSNTWGDIANADERHPANIRWTGVLQDTLGNNYDVSNEGLCGRTFVAEDPQKPFRTGITHLKSILRTHNPVDIITIMLGTNDVKNQYALSVNDIATHLGQTIKLIREEGENSKGEEPQIIVICPPSIVNPNNGKLDERLKNAPSIFPKLHPAYKKIAEEMGCQYINASDFISLEDTDGYHLNVNDHKALGQKVATIIKSLD